MKILVWPAGPDNDGVAQYRLLMPARVLADNDIEVEVDRTGPTILWDREWDGEMPPADIGVIGLAQRPDADVIVMQRPSRRHWSLIMPFLQAAGIRVVVDVDDRFDAIHKNHVGWHAYQPQYAPGNNYRWISQACKTADLVTCSTPALQAVYGFGHSRVLPNFVPESYLAIEPEPDECVGWAGSVRSHPADLQVTKGAVQEALEGTEWFFHTIGTGEGVQEALSLAEEPSATYEWVPFSQYPHRLAELGIGIVPLEDSAFNHCKCLDGGTRIATRRGILPLREVEVGDTVWNDGRWRKVEATEAQAPREGVLLTTSGGRQLRLTREHRLWVDGQWTSAAQITIGNVVATTPDVVGKEGYVSAPWPSDGRVSRRRGNYDRLGFVNAVDAPRITITERWGRLLGLFAGDGSVGSGVAMTFSCDGQDGDLIALLMDDLRQVGLWPSTERVTTWGGEVLRRRSVRASSTHLLRFLRSIGVVEGNKRKVCVPEVIWRSPRPVVAAFLAGLFEADGSSAQSSVSLTTKHEDFARDVQRLLTAIGIEASVKGRVVRLPRSDRRTRYWNVNMRRAGADVFVKEVGFLSERKQLRLLMATNKPHSNAYRPMKWQEKIVSVEPCWLEPIDLQVDGSVFAAAGFVSHNSALKLMESAAVGVPTVASPTPDNLRVHKLGIGLMAASPQRWTKHIRALIRHPDYRAELGSRSRDAMKPLTYENHADLWLRAWTGKR